MLNSFQKWAIAYARDCGFTVMPKGNWVELRHNGEPIECMSEFGVRAACAAARERLMVMNYVSEGLGEV